MEVTQDGTQQWSFVSVLANLRVRTEFKKDKQLNQTQRKVIRSLTKMLIL
jgi:hypothetical protein